MITKANAGGALVHESELPVVNTAVTDAETQAAASAALLETRAPEGVWVNGIPLVRDLTFTTDDLNTYDRETIDQKIASIAGGGYNPVHVNGHLLDRDIILTPADLEMPTKSEFDAGGTNYVPTSRTINGKALTGDITLTPGDVGTYSVTEVTEKVGAFVPDTRKINGHPLSADVTLTPGDVGAPAIADVVPPTFTINDQPLTGEGVILTGEGDAYTRTEIDAKLSDYLSMFNDFGLGNKPIPLTYGKLIDSVRGSGFFTYAPGEDIDEHGDPIETALEDAPPGSTEGAILAVATGDDTTPGVTALAITKEGEFLSRTGDTWEKVGTDVPDIPVPDLWVPLNDSLVMLTGEGPYDTVSVNGTPLQLTSKSVTFTRASTATYIDKAGYPQTAAMNIPRFERDGLLIESQSTNLLPYSHNFDTTQTIGGKFYPYNDNLITTRNADGSWHVEDNKASTNTGDLARRMLISTSMPLAGGKTYTLSARGMNGTHALIVYGSALGTGTPEPKVGGNLTFPTSSWGVSSFTFESVQDGWIIFEIYGNPEGETQSSCDPFELHYVQLEESNVATSYIPTNGTSATRAADICTMPTINIGETTGDLTISAEISNIGMSINSYPRILTTCTVDENVGFYFVYNENMEPQWGPNGVPLNGVKESRIYTVVTTKDGAKFYIGNQGVEVLGMKRGSIRDPEAVIMGRAWVPGTKWNIRNLRVWNYKLTDEQIRGLA